MTKLLDEAVAVVRSLPSTRQDAIAAVILDLADQDAEPIDPEHIAAIDEGLAQVERGEFANDDEIAAAFRRFES